MAKTLLFLFVLFGTVCSQAQTANVKEQKVDALNEYVNLLNEGIHGMLIVHRLLETYNQELNKYVDLESYQINNFSNADLPKDIFEDPENWFYDTSPQEWKAKTISNKTLTAAEKKNLASDIQSVLAVLADINKIRFEVETLIATKNLEVRTEIAQVYEKLEEGVDHYEEFYKAYENINRKLLSTYKPLKPSQEEIQFQELYSIFFKIYMTTKLSLKYIREKDDEKLPKFISDLASGIQELSAYDFNAQGSTRLQNKKMLRARTDILRQAKSTLDKLKKFYNDGTVPVEFTDHGRYYFYYNSDVINNFNRYGNGVVFEMNRVFDNLDMPVLKFLEMPHYFKVLYPEEIIDTRPLAATNPNIKAAPENLKARKITSVTGKIIVDSLTFSIEIFDSKIKDGDVISFNYNKDWILNEQKLSDVAVKLRLKLNEDGKNFFILHSDDMGRNPPTTIGIRYNYGGEVKTIKLSSNLNTSEMIEIEYRPI